MASRPSAGPEGQEDCSSCLVEELSGANTNVAVTHFHLVESTTETRGSRPTETCLTEPRRGRPEAGGGGTRSALLCLISVSLLAGSALAGVVVAAVLVMIVVVVVVVVNVSLMPT